MAQIEPTSISRRSCLIASSSLVEDHKGIAPVQQHRRRCQILAASGPDDDRRERAACARGAEAPLWGAIAASSIIDFRAGRICKLLAICM